MKNIVITVISFIGFIIGSIFNKDKGVDDGEFWIISNNGDFKISTFDPEELAKDIWFHPSKYSAYKDGSEEALRSFHNKLFIIGPDLYRERFLDYVRRVRKESKR